MGIEEAFSLPVYLWSSRSVLRNAITDLEQLSEIIFRVFAVHSHGAC